MGIRVKHIGSYIYDGDIRVNPGQVVEVPKELAAYLVNTFLCSEDYRFVLADYYAIDEVPKLRVEERVAILMPVYNTKLEYLDVAIDSCFGDYKNVILIVYDDGSTNGARKLIEDKAKIESRIMVLGSSEHIGVGEARRRIMNAIPDDIRVACWCDSDDINTENRVSFQLAYLQEIESKHPEAKFMVEAQANRFCKDEEADLRGINSRDVKGHTFDIPTLMFVVDKNILPDDNNGAYENWGEDFRWLKKMEKAGYILASTPWILYNYRQHEGSLSRQFARKELKKVDGGK